MLKKLNQLNPARFVLEIISAQASYIDMLLELSEHDKALKAAIDLEALPHPYKVLRDFRT